MTDDIRQHVDVSHVINVYTTPKELRELADKMDARIKTLRIGDSLFVDYLPSRGPGQKIQVNISEWITRE